MSTARIDQNLFLPIREGALNAEVLTRPSLSYWKDAARRFRKNPVAVIATVLLAIIILFAIFAPMVSPYTYDENNWEISNQGPTWVHPFGTDSLGRDLWVRCWEGARVSLTIGVLVALVNATIGILFGGISGFVGGNLDIVLMRICEVIGALPQLLWVTLLVIVLRPGFAPIIIALSATGWIGMARLFRGQVFQIKQSEFVMASRCLGTGKMWIIIKHLVPNAMSPIITSLAFAIPGAIFAEAFLSYIGLGLPLPLASWGNLASNGANVFLTYPYQLLFPSLLICITMLSFTLIVDALRDALDPRMRK
ncbi:MAG: ABC transporter permease [Firmicutes bacterium]|nr:ABC transporter permease [Bacillota bacterium]